MLHNVTQCYSVVQVNVTQSYSQCNVTQLTEAKILLMAASSWYSVAPLSMLPLNKNAIDCIEQDCGFYISRIVMQVMINCTMYDIWSRKLGSVPEPRSFPPMHISRNELLPSRPWEFLNGMGFSGTGESFSMVWEWVSVVQEKVSLWYGNESQWYRRKFLYGMGMSLSGTGESFSMVWEWVSVVQEPVYLWYGNESQCYRSKFLHESQWYRGKFLHESPEIYRKPLS